MEPPKGRHCVRDTKIKMSVPHCKLWRKMLGFVAGARGERFPRFLGKDFTGVLELQDLCCPRLPSQLRGETAQWMVRGFMRCSKRDEAPQPNWVSQKFRNERTFQEVSGSILFKGCRLCENGAPRRRACRQPCLELPVLLSLQPKW